MTVTNFVWDELSDNVLMEVDDAGGITAEYSNEPSLYGELVSQRRSQKNNYYHFDAQRSTRQLTTGSQEESDAYIYSAFGEVIANSGTTTNPFRSAGAIGYYTNSETDELYARRRTFDPVNGRWYSTDPLIFSDGINLYCYANNKPTEIFDPSGTLSVRLREYDLVNDKAEPRPSYHFIVQYIEPMAPDGHILANLHFEYRYFRPTDPWAENDSTDCLYRDGRFSYWEWFRLDGRGRTPYPGPPDVDEHLWRQVLCIDHICVVQIKATILYGLTDDISKPGPFGVANQPPGPYVTHGDCVSTRWSHVEANEDTLEPNAEFSGSVKTWRFSYFYARQNGCCCKGESDPIDAMTWIGVDQ